MSKVIPIEYNPYLSIEYFPGDYADYLRTLANGISDTSGGPKLIFLYSRYNSQLRVYY